MQHETEEQIWRLLRDLQKLEGSPQAIALRDAAAENLRALVATGIFESFTADASALMHIIATDPKMRNTDRDVARALLVAYEPGADYARLSKPQISDRTGMSVSTVRAALKRLVAADYFIAIAPSARESDDGDFVVRYRPCFSVAS